MPVRLTRTTLRSAHLLAFGAYFGGHVFDVDPDRLIYGLLAVIATGVLFTSFEIWRAPVWVTQIRGIATFVKLGLFCCVPVFWDRRIAILVAITIIGSVVSHMPGRYRYYSVVQRRVIPSDSKG